MATSKSQVKPAAKFSTSTGIAICAPIAPYAQARAVARELVTGGWLADEAGQPAGTPRSGGPRPGDPAGPRHPPAVNGTVDRPGRDFAGYAAIARRGQRRRKWQVVALIESAVDSRVPGYLGRVLDADANPVGTCFQVAPRILMTAWHVLEAAGSAGIGAAVLVDPLGGGAVITQCRGL